MASSAEALVELESRLEGVTLEEVASRHRRERKELQAKLQALKKNAPKNDKKKRKEYLEQVAQLEGEMEQRHKAELQAAEQTGAIDNQVATTPEPAQSDTESVAKQQEESTLPAQRVSKAQKRRDKKAREAREREQEIRSELLSTSNQFSAKANETELINEKLASRKLVLHLIPSDGDCLYNAVRHQLQIYGLPSYTVGQLRQETANYVRAHKDTLINYMTHPESGELLNDKQFDEYCHAIANTHTWGGHIELKALSSLLRVPIEVLQAEGAPTILGAEEFPGAPLIICYHRHIYQMGEHYNSSLPLEDQPTD